MKMMERKEYQLKVREHSRNMQMLSSRHASTNRLQEIRPRRAILNLNVFNFPNYTPNIIPSN